MVIGVIFWMFSVSPYKWLRWTAEIFVDVIRGIPFMILAAFIFWGIPNLIESVIGHQSPINDFVAGTIALSLNAAAYIAEIVRGDSSSSDWTDGSQPALGSLMARPCVRSSCHKQPNSCFQTLLTNSSLPWKIRRSFLRSDWSNSSKLVKSSLLETTKVSRCMLSCRFLPRDYHLANTICKKLEKKVN